VQTNDHMLLQLELASGAFAQLLSSYAVPGTQAPTLEIHGTFGSIALYGVHGACAPVDTLVADPTGSHREEWTTETMPHTDGGPADRLVGWGARHFFRCLRGTEAPTLTAEHAAHVTNIVTAAYESIERGRQMELAEPSADGGVTG
jgi:predicted dehydrogenase